MEFAKADAEGRTFTDLSTKHMACRVQQGALVTKASDCNTLLKVETGLMDAACKALTDWEAIQTKKGACPVAPTDTFSFFTASMAKKFADLGQQWQKLADVCDAAKAKVNQLAGCKSETTSLQTTSASCDKIQVQMDGASSDSVTLSRQRCTASQSCFTANLAAFKKAVSAAKLQEEGMRGESGDLDNRFATGTAVP